MRGSMIIAQPQRVSIMLSIILNIAYVLTTTALSNPRGLTLDLIHRDLIYPQTNAPGGVADISIAKNTNETSYHKKQVGRLKSIGPIFVVEFYIGTPGIQQFAVLDTGSSFPVVQCTRPEDGHSRLSDFYNESKSSSYIPSSYDHQYCKLVSDHQRDAKNRCEYNIGFLDGGRSEGHIGFETISFSDGGHRNRSAIITNVLFGCGTDNYNPHRYEDGIFGIGGLLPLSIVRRTLGARFSFCFGSISGPSNSYNHLALGSDARLEGNYIQYQPNRNGQFGVTFNSIIFGSTSLNLHNLTVYIDSGATVSYFERNVYNAIKSKVGRIIGIHMRTKNSTEFQGGLCYETTHIWGGFPNVTIESGGLHLLVLSIRMMFIKTDDDAFCLAMKPYVGLNVLGAVQMQYHNVGFDLGSSRAYFQRKRICSRR